MMLWMSTIPPLYMTKPGAASSDSPFLDLAADELGAGRLASSSAALFAISILLPSGIADVIVFIHIFFFY